MYEGSKKRALAAALLLPAAATAFLLPSNHPDYDQARPRDIGLLNLASGTPSSVRVRGSTSSGVRTPAHPGAPIPLKITNNCPNAVWPGILTQEGLGPGTGGFQLLPNQSRQLWVGSTWQGRVWGRTNCTVSGDSCSCLTGDCFQQLNCQFAGAVPASLLEFNLAGGVNNDQTFYDISLVDGYNLPVGIRYLPAKNTTFIPPNLTNCACIASPNFVQPPALSGTYYSNATYPIPLEGIRTASEVRNLCPWSLLKFPPDRPGSGIFPYPDDTIEHPDFSPCLSQCAGTGTEESCCIGPYNSPQACHPSVYSNNFKTVCPDSYTYAFDDQSSTFIIPKGGGFECLFCPQGRSTNILKVLGSQLQVLASAGHLSPDSLKDVRNATYVDTIPQAGAAGPALRSHDRRGLAAAFVSSAAVVVALLLA